MQFFENTVFCQAKCCLLLLCCCKRHTHFSRKNSKVDGFHIFLQQFLSSSQVDNMPKKRKNPAPAATGATCKHGSEQVELEDKDSGSRRQLALDEHGFCREDDNKYLNDTRPEDFPPPDKDFNAVKDDLGNRFLKTRYGLLRGRDLTNTLYSTPCVFVCDHFGDERPTITAYPCYISYDWSYNWREEKEKKKRQ